jgi:hypothetical protein
VKCSATQCGFRVTRLYADRCALVVKVSVTGPGKPYCKMPVGLTGASRTEGGGREIGAGTGTAGDVRDGEGNDIVLGIELSDLEREEEKIKAVRAAPAPADVAAIIARVVLDILTSTQIRCRGKIQRVESKSTVAAHGLQCAGQ